MKATAPLILAAALAGPAAGHAEPLFLNSIVSTDIDFINADDPHVFECIEYNGRDRREMPDKRRDELFANDAFVFTARFADGTRVGLWAHPDFRSPETALATAEKITRPLGKLPTFMRRNLSHVVLHVGDETAFAEDLGRFFVMYSENIDDRVRTRDIEETVFHEAVHATLDEPHARSGIWQRAQAEDDAFVTQYAADFPQREDLAESAIFAFAMHYHPGRLPRAVERNVRATMPERLGFFDKLFEAGEPYFQQIAEPRGCDG
ncbi:MAG: hypothetical protein AAF771_11675 [Pseudomonadota bacterium]